MFKVEDKVVAKINGKEVQGIVKDSQAEWRYVVEYKNEAGETVSELVYHEDVTAAPAKVQTPVQTSAWIKTKK